MEEMAGYECQVGEGLPVIQAYAQQRRLQGLYDLFELCPGDAVLDLHHQPDRASES